MDDLKTILKTAMQKYASAGLNCQAFALFDDERQTYGVNLMYFAKTPYQASVVVFARLVEDTIIIESDTTDKPLYKRLMQFGVPREKIVLVYAGEPYPAFAAPTEADLHGIELAVVAAKMG